LEQQQALPASFRVLGSEGLEEGGEGEGAAVEIAMELVGLGERGGEFSKGREGLEGEEGTAQSQQRHQLVDEA
jgi:hypothetical protein